MIWNYTIPAELLKGSGFLKPPADSCFEIVSLALKSSCSLLNGNQSSRLAH